MSKPPIDPRDRTINDQPTWRDLLITYGLIAAIPAGLALYSYPLLGSVAVAALAGLLLASRRTLQLYRCFQTCGGFALELGDSVQVCVSQPATNC